MSTNGDIEIAVTAEGVDEAASELDGDGGDGDSSGGIGGDGESVTAEVDEKGLSDSIRGGIIGGLVAGFLGGILDTLEPIANIMDAFIKPLAVGLLRAFMPVLRWLIRRLPRWLRFVEESRKRLEGILSFIGRLVGIARGIINGIMNFGTEIQQFKQTAVGRLTDVRDTLFSLPEDIWALVSGLPMQIWQQFSDDIDSLTSDISNLPGDIKAFITNLPADIGNAVARRLPGGQIINGGDGGGNDLFGQAAGAARDTAERGRDTIINLTGGLDSFVDEAASSTDVDLFR